MSDELPANRPTAWKRWALIVVVGIVVCAAPLGLLGLRGSEFAGIAPAQREEGIVALLIEDKNGTLRLTSLLLTPENADRPVAGEIGLTLKVERTPGPFFAARETRLWRTQYAIDPNFGERLPTGDDVWRALLARFAREHGLAEGDAAEYLGRADGTETRLHWGGVVANGAILEIQLLALAAIVIVIVVWARRNMRTSAHSSVR